MAYAFNSLGSTSGSGSQSKIDATGEAADLLAEVAGTEEGARILSVLEADEDISRIRIRVNERLAGPGSIDPMKDPRPGLFRRLFGGWKQTYTLDIQLNPNAPNNFFYDVDGNPFVPSGARILGHELGHAYIFSRHGYPGYVRYQTGAITIENTIARQLSPTAPMRHPTRGHGSPTRDLLERWGR